MSINCEYIFLECQTSIYMQANIGRIFFFLMTFTYTVKWNKTISYKACNETSIQYLKSSVVKHGNCRGCTCPENLQVFGYSTNKLHYSTNKCFFCELAEFHYLLLIIYIYIYSAQKKYLQFFA